jgi:FkbM family methyltransferase
MIKLLKTRLYGQFLGYVSKGLLSKERFRRYFTKELFDNHFAAKSLGYVEFSDHALLVDPRDHMIGYALMRGQEWQRNDFNAAIETLEARSEFQSGGWFVDVGANIGTQTIYALLSGRFCGAISIEPDPANRALLQRNIALNGLESKVRVVAVAASCESGQAMLVQDARNFGAHSIEVGYPMNPDTQLVVDTMTLDEIIAAEGIAISDVGMVVVDVEGHELSVAKGMTKLIERQVPMVIEVSAGRPDQSYVQQLLLLLEQRYSIASCIKAQRGRPSSVSSSEVRDVSFNKRHMDILFHNKKAA